MAAATVLGVLTFDADAVDRAAGQAVIAQIGSGLAWGVAVLLASRTAADP